MNIAITQWELEAIFNQLPPVQLLGLALLRQSQAGPGFFPTIEDEVALAEATIELIDYITTCQSLVARLHDLPPVALAISIPEFSL